MDMFKKITFVRFCLASAAKLPGDLGLPTEKLICLYKECIEMAKHCNDISAMMHCCVQFVMHSNSIGRHADSLRCLKEILPSAEAIPRYELIVHKYLSKTYDELKEFDNVVLHAKKWIEIAGNIGDKVKEIDGNLKMGYAFTSLACYDDALYCGKKCLEIAQETGSAEGEMRAYECIMFTHKGMQKHDDTILYASKLLDCAMKINDKMAMETAYFELGRAHLVLNHYQDATDFATKCIEIAKEIKDRCGEVSAYLLIGGIYQAIPDYDNAIIYCKKCIELAITIGDKHFISHARCIDIVNCIGREKEAAVIACSKLIEIYNTMEQYNDAVYYSKKCIDMAQETGEKSIKARAYLCLLLSHLKLDEEDNAIQYGKKYLNLSQETNDKKMQMDGHYLLAHVYLRSMQINDASLSIDAGMAIATELGDKDDKKSFKVIRSIMYSNVGLLDKAKACDEPLVKEYLEIPTCSEDDLIEDLAQAVKTGDKLKKYAAYIRLSIFYTSKKNYEKAINCFEQIKEMDICRSENLNCFTEIGNLYWLMGQNDMALRCFKEGLSTAESCSDNMERSKFYYYIGNAALFLSSEDLNLAERYLREAIRCFEAIFSSLGTRDEFKISIFDQYIDSYKLLAGLLIKGKRIEEALLVLDRCRARALKDLLISNFKMKQEGSNNEHLEYSDVLSLISRNDFSISYYSLCFGSLLNFFLGRQASISYYSLFFDSFLNFFLGRQSSICYYSLCFDSFLNFFLGRQANCSFSIFPKISMHINVDKLFDEMGVREVVNCEDRSLDKEQDIQTEQNRSKEEYEGLHQQTASLLNLDSKRGESNEDSAETKGSTLEVLFRILECDRILLSKEDEVVVIPEGPLYQVPFPALRDPHTGKYLSETKRIRLAPSLATLKHFEDFPADLISNAEPLIIGDPLVGKVMMDGEERDIEPLPGAREEAAEISLLLNTPALFTKHATKPAVIKRLQEGVSVVHIAAHGMLSKATIALAPSPEIRATKIPDEEDYMLTMADVQQAHVRAQLVVLSCCHSGRGEIRAEGVVGMCRAFLASGARAVVASLWAIDDDATCEFMQNFYLSLKDGKSTSASLQEAMKEMRNTSKFSKPKYWAPFFLMGDDVTINF